MKFKQNECAEPPAVGKTIKTRNKDMMGKVKKIGKDGTVYFETEDGRLMKTSMRNVVEIEQLADQDEPILELSVNKLKQYASKTKEIDPVADKFKTVKHIDGYKKANQRIAVKTGDRRRAYEEILSDKLQHYIKEVFDPKSFSDILGKQHNAQMAAAPKAKVVEIDFHGWKIKYRPTSNPQERVQWQILDKKGDIKCSGEAMTAKNAVSTAEDWIKRGGGSNQTSEHNVTLDFNARFTREFAPEGETFYIIVDNDSNTPLLYVSTEPQKGMKRSHVRPKSKDQVVSITPEEANKAGLQPHGRYILGDRDVIDPITSVYPLIFQGIAQSKDDKMRMSHPGLTVATSRNTYESRLQEYVKESFKINKQGQIEFTAKEPDKKFGVYVEGKLIRTYWGIEAAEKMIPEFEKRYPGTIISIKEVN